MTTPHTTPVQQENQLFLLRFSALTYEQQGSFHEVHCNGAWLASHVFVVLMPTHTTPVNNNNNKKTKKGEQKEIECLCYISLLLFLSVLKVSVLCGPFVSYLTDNRLICLLCTYLFVMYICYYVLIPFICYLHLFKAEC